ncbi:ketosteroid isomerase-like protein [Granulicella aggregans]|uniref:Ketosteroid isomerase-like protein n=1 Tax=Granulicella aggregans TaxID=474949 RepID=A0A7W7ZJP9_9BACT|nr:nuclear transport factor 2 family protein [Granulicella aggregans]MBB5061176.1 ketosteroid isomerase-like protein [Granulicella aggregans]
MTTSVSNRRSFFLSAVSLAGAAAVSSNLIAQPAPTNLTAFLKTYDDAWASHDPLAIAMLHSADVLVVNRFGSMLEGRPELERAMQFLHAAGGPFHAVTFPRQELLVSRMLKTDMATLHARWKNPTMGPGDQLAHGNQTPWVDLLSTYLLARQGDTWQIVQHDLHSVDPIKFPFKTKWNG